MKWESRTVAIILGVFTASLLGSILFLFGLINFDVYNAQVSGVHLQFVQPYLELAYIIISLLVATALMLMLIKHNLSKIIVGIFAVISFFILANFYAVFFFYATYASVYAEMIAIAAAVLSVIYYFKYAGNIGRNTINIMIFITISAAIAIALGPIPSLILVGVIAVYDYISVFITKHMITLAKGLSEKSFLAGITFMARSEKKKVAMLGGGDIVFPAILIDAMFFLYSTLAGIFVFAAAVLGLAIIILFGKKGKAYPAMAVIGPLQILFFGIYVLITAI